MFSKILIATDASEASDHLISCLADLRKVGAQHVVLAHVCNVETVGAVSEATQRLHERKLQEQSRVLVEMGFTTEIKLPWGVPFVEIDNLATQTDASLIAVASHGRSLVAQALLGSTAHAIVEHVRRPVLIVRLALSHDEKGKTVCATACRELFNSVLFPTDFSNTAERAFQYLEHIVRETKPSVTLLHVQEKARITRHHQWEQRLEEFNRIDMGRLERLRERLLALGVPGVGIDLPFGHTAQEIVQRAGGSGHTLALMGTHGRGYVSELFLGSAAFNVARRVSIPLLLVPNQP